MTFRIRLKVRKLMDDPRITDLRQKAATARRQHKSTVRYDDEIRRIRMARLREVFGEVASVATLFVGGFIAYCAACPLEALI